jgi:hypothetical protein
MHQTIDVARQSPLSSNVATVGVRLVWSVHATRPDELGAVEVIFPTEREAREYARDRSRDDRIISASVTRFTVGELGTRHPVAWYQDGVEQPMRWNDRQLYPRAPECR